MFYQGRVIAFGTYNELHKQNVNFSEYVKQPDIEGDESKLPESLLDEFSLPHNSTQESISHNSDFEEDDDNDDDTNQSNSDLVTDNTAFIGDAGEMRIGPVKLVCITRMDRFKNELLQDPVVDYHSNLTGASINLENVFL